MFYRKDKINFPLRAFWSGTRSMYINHSHPCGQRYNCPSRTLFKNFDQESDVIVQVGIN